MTAPDSRIPVRFGVMDDGVPGVALLIEGDAPAPAGAPCAHFRPRPFTHPAGCACCASRDPVAEALARLFLARVRGRTAPFQAVVAVTRSEAGRRAVRAALGSDPMSMARFRLD